jgi:hypothetical protein
MRAPPEEFRKSPAIPLAQAMLHKMTSSIACGSTTFWNVSRICSDFFGFATALRQRPVAAVDRQFLVHL